MKVYAATALACCAIGSSGSTAGPADPPAAATGCTAAIRTAIARRSIAGVPSACWRMGPIALGENRVAVEAAIGKPVAEADVTNTLPKPKQYRAVLYVSPTPTLVPSRGRLRIRMTELLYDADRLAAINNSPPSTLDSTGCSSQFWNHPDKAVDVGAPVGPFRRFDAIGIGDRLAKLRHLYGGESWSNRSKDWYTYWPVPITVDVDSDTTIIDGIAIATDEQAGSILAMPWLHVRRDPATCRPLSIAFALPAG